jgi:hypothetical protein
VNSKQNHLTHEEIKHTLAKVLEDQLNGIGGGGEGDKYSVLSIIWYSGGEKGAQIIDSHG